MGFVLARLASPICRWFPILQFNRSSQKEDENENCEPDPRLHFFQSLALLETGERDDYQAALALQRDGSLPPQTPAQLEMCRVSFAELLEKFLVADMAAEGPQLETGPSGPKGPIHRTWLKKREQASVECVVCCDAFENVACLNGPCGHFICRQCVIMMAEVANNNEGLFPLQCCQQQLPMDTFLSFLPGPLRTTFSFKCAEAATPPSFRIYCPNKTCLNFIGRSPASTPCVVSCPECSTDVCSGCKSRAHPGESCDDRQGREVRSLAKEKGWKTCPKCKIIVERSAGCAHMQCRCQQEFCYACGAKWGYCACVGR